MASSGDKNSIIQLYKHSLPNPTHQGNLNEAVYWLKKLIKYDPAYIGELLKWMRKRNRIENDYIRTFLELSEDSNTKVYLSDYCRTIDYDKAISSLENIQHKDENAKNKLLDLLVNRHTDFDIVRM